MVDLNHRRAKLNLTFKLLGVFSVMLTVVLLLVHPVNQLSVRSLWLYPLVFIVHWLYVICGPTITGFYLYKKMGLMTIGPPVAIGALAILLWFAVLSKKKLEPQIIFLPVVMWLVSGGWTTWLMMLAGK